MTMRFHLFLFSAARHPGHVPAMSLVGLVLSMLITCTSHSELYAHGGGGDIALYNDNGAVGVGFAVLDDDDINQVLFDPSDIVHQSIFLPQPPVPPFFSFGSTEPGFDADELSLTPNSPVTLTTLSLSYWDGSGSVSFQPLADGMAAYSPSTILSTDDDGGFHAHPTLGLSGSSIVEGVYLTETTVSVPGMADSAPYYVVALVDDVINSDVDPEGAAEALGELIRDYQADPLNAPAPMYGGRDFTFYVDAVTAVEAQVPEPATFGMMLVGSVAWLMLRALRLAD